MRWLGVALLVALAMATAAAADGSRIAYALSPRPPGVAIGVLAELANVDIRATDPILAGDVAALHLADADSDAMAQALAQAAGAWWLRDSDGALLLRHDLAVPESGPLSVRSYPSNLRNRHDLDPLVRDCLAPWLAADGAGLAYIPWTGQWTATLDPDGHAQLGALLVLLETDRVQVPSPLPAQDLPPPQQMLDRTRAGSVRGADWAGLLLAAARQLDINLSIAPDMALEALPATASIDCSTPAALETELAERGLHARWISGVLCVGREPVVRRANPARQRRLASIPVPHLAARYGGELVAAALRRTTGTAQWAVAGRTCRFVDRPARLLVAAEPALLDQLLDALDDLERTGSLGGGGTGP